MKTAVRIALAQILVIESDWSGNLQRIESALAKTVGQDVDLVVFPESALLGWVNPDAHELATAIPGPDADRVAALARRFRVAIAIGLDEKSGAELYDSAILVDKDGVLRAKHRKINTLSYLVHPPYADGPLDGVGVTNLEFGRVGLLICADTFLEEAVDRMAELRPDLLIVPYGWAAEPNEWPEHSGALHELVAKVARLLGCPVVGVNSVGVIGHGPWQGKTYGGSSIAVDVEGQSVAILADRDVDLQIVTLLKSVP